MSATIDPVIHDSLTRYANRQRRWIVLRSILIALAVWILAILVVTWIDAAWVIERGTRSLLTLAAYALAAAVFVALALPRLWGQEPMRRAALALERARPEMRDRLLSALELAEAAAMHPLSSSRAFIQAAQRDVALKMSRLDISELLPLRMLRRPMVATTALFAAAASLVLIPNLQYGNRFARAIIPGIDLDRVSRTRIVIIRPDPPSRNAPAGELTAITIRTLGRPAGSAQLQWESEDGSHGMLDMNPLAETFTHGASAEPSVSFAVNLPVQQAPVRYRILAGDGVTAWHRLRPQPRPAAREFEKEITPPAYSRLPTRTETSADGELRGLRGSSVRLSVRFDMPVVDARLRMLGDDSRIMMNGSGDYWTAVLPLQREDRYQVLARSEATGFDNALSPQYEILADSDQPPSVNWLQQEGERSGQGTGAIDKRDAQGSVAAEPRRRLVTSQSTIALTATIVDEMPIERLFQETAVNSGPWKLRPLDEPVSAQPQASIVARWSWDLTLLATEGAPLRPGDLVRTRVVAIDGMGQRGQSEVHEYLISDEALDARRRGNVRAWADLVDKLGDWKAAVRRRLVHLQIESPPQGSEGTAEAVEAGDDAALPLDQQTAALLERLAAMTRAALHDGEAGELEMLGRGVARVGRAVARAEAADAAEREAFASAGKSAELVENAARYATAHRLSVTLAEDFDRMFRAMRPLLDAGSAVQWESFARYHQVTQQQFRDIAELIVQMHPTVPAATQNHNEQLRRWIDTWINRLADATGPDVGEERVRATTRDLANDLGSRRRIGMVDGPLPSLSGDAHNRLNELAGWNAPALYEAQELAVKLRHARQGADQLDSEKAKAASDLHQRLSARLGEIAEQLDRDAEMNLRRGEADRRYVADVRMLRRVLEIVGDPQYTPPEDQPLHDVLGELALAFHQLEAGHWWTQWLIELRTLADGERWDIDSAASRIDAPMRWERIQRGLDHALTGLERAKIPRELRHPLQSQRHSAEVAKISSSITSRRWQQTVAISMADGLDATHAALDAAGRAMAPALADARRRIEAYLPDLAEMARGAAESLRQAEKVAQQQQEPAPKDAADELQQRLVEAQQQAETLRQALADEANVQDLTVPEGMRKARDADIASRAIEQQMQIAGEAAKQAAQQAQQASDETAAQQAVRDAAGPVGAAAETLEQIAAHYQNARSADPGDSQAAPPSLAALEQQLGLQEQLDQAFARSRSLAETLQSDPRELLKKLAAELKRNAQMRQELNDIARQSIQDAQRSLQQQAEREHQLRLELEKQDPQILTQKRQLEETLRAASDGAAAVQRSMLHAAKQAAARMANLPENVAHQAQAARAQLEAASQQLQQSAQELSSLKSAEQELLEDLRQRADQLSEQLGAAAAALQQSEAALQQLAGDPAAALPGDQQKAEQRDMQNLQRQARDTLAGAVRNHQNRISQSVTSAKQQSQQIAQQVQQAQRQLAEAEQRLEKDRDDAGLQQQRDRAAARLAREQQRQETAKRDLQRRRQAVDQATERLAEIGRTPLAPLQQPRPAAELAHGMQHNAVAQLRKDQQSLAEASASVQQTPALQATADLLGTTQQAQRHVQAEVLRAAENLQRAARHQERLGELNAAQSMAQTAQAVQQVAGQEVNQAREAIAQAAQTAQSQQQATAEASASNESLGGAERAISAQAEALLALIEQAADQTAPGQNRAEDSRAASARQLAQTLDELDRSLTQSRQPRDQQPQPPDSAGEPGESGEPGEEGAPGEGAESGQSGRQGQPGGNPAAGQDSRSSSPTLAAAARRQMQQMAMQRTLPEDGRAPQGTEGPVPDGEQAEGAAGEGESALSGPGNQGNDPALLRLPDVEPGSEGDWNKLRALQAEDTSVGRRVEVSPEFRRQIEAYFRVIAEQAKGD